MSVVCLLSFLFTTLNVLLRKSAVLLLLSSSWPLPLVSWSVSGSTSTSPPPIHLNTTDFPSGTHFIGGTGQGQSDAAWLVPICLQLAPAIVLFIGIMWMPFSPRWLLHHGREEEARQVLANLRDLPTDHELIELEFLEIKAQSLFEKRSLAERFPHLQEQTAGNIFKLQFVAMGALFKTKAMFKRVIVATVTMFFQQWTGINAVSPPYSFTSQTNCLDSLLRSVHLWPTRYERQHHFSPRHRSRRNRHVHRHYPRCSLDRSSGS